MGLDYIALSIHLLSISCVAYPSAIHLLILHLSISYLISYLISPFTNYFKELIKEGKESELIEKVFLERCLMFSTRSKFWIEW